MVTACPRVSGCNLQKHSRPLLHGKHLHGRDESSLSCKNHFQISFDSCCEVFSSLTILISLPEISRDDAHVYWSHYMSTIQLIASNLLRLLWCFMSTCLSHDQGITDDPWSCNLQTWSPLLHRWFTISFTGHSDSHDILPCFILAWHSILKTGGRFTNLVTPFFPWLLAFFCFFAFLFLRFGVPSL